MDRLVHRSDDQEPVAQVEVSTGCFCGVVFMIPIPLFGGVSVFLDLVISGKHENCGNCSAGQWGIV